MAMPIRPQLAAVLNSASSLRATALSRLWSLKPAQLEWKPREDQWSIAQVLDHLNKSASAILPVFEEALRTGTAAGHEREETIRPSFSDRVFLKIVSVNPPIKVPVPPLLQPDAAPDPRQTRDLFFLLHDAISEVIVRADDFRLREINITSPINSRLKPSFLTYLEGTVTHEQYHWKQIEAVLSDEGFPR